MNKLYSLLSKLFFLTIFISSPLLANHQPEYLPVNNVVAPSQTLNPERLALLTEYFESKGLDIKELLQDPRFKLYNGISDRFRNAVEFKSKSFKEYQKVLGYEDKFARLPGFMETHAETLAKAEKEYEIPRYVIAAIIGVESDYGRVVGKYNPFNAYVSMYSEDYRASFAQAQLEELLIFARDNDLDLFEMKSSYAGAMAYAQFIPYSLNRWFVGKDIYNMDNNILSVAKYLSHFKDITGSVEKAVYRYNPSEMYTQAVMTLAREGEELLAEAN